MNNTFNISVPRYCIRHVWDIKKHYSLFYLIFKSNWAYCILSDNPTPDPHGTWSAEVDLYEVSLTSLLRNSWKPQRMCLFVSWFLFLSLLQKYLHNFLYPAFLGVQAHLFSIDKLYNDFWVFTMWATVNHSQFFDVFGMERRGMSFNALASEFWTHPW